MAHATYEGPNPNLNKSPHVGLKKMIEASVDRFTEGRRSWAYENIVPRFMKKSVI